MRIEGAGTSFACHFFVIVSPVVDAGGMLTRTPQVSRAIPIKTTGNMDGTAAASGGILSRERIIANAGFNRWLVPPAALAIHLCIGMAYGFSVFWLPLSRSAGTAIGAKVPACAGAATSFWDKTLGTLTALTATNCEWTQFDLGWMFTLFFVVLGSSAAIWGGWLEHAGPRKAGVYAALCWCGALMISAIGVRTHQLWMLWIGSGVIGGIGLGLGYISPVSTLVKWFPDRRGMATGMAIMGFGGGAMIGSPLANLLMNHFKTPVSVGVWQTFVVLGLGYFVYMIAGAFGYRVPPDGWSPEGWTPPATQKAMITANHVDLKNAHKTPQFWLIWAVLCLNVSAGTPRRRCCRRRSAVRSSTSLRSASRSLPTRKRLWPPRSGAGSSDSSRCSTSAAGFFGQRFPIRSAARGSILSSSISAYFATKSHRPSRA
jgi:MFS family permease